MYISHHKLMDIHSNVYTEDLSSLLYPRIKEIYKSKYLTEVQKDQAWLLNTSQPTAKVSVHEWHIHNHECQINRRVTGEKINNFKLMVICFFFNELQRYLGNTPGRVNSQNTDSWPKWKQFSLKYWAMQQSKQDRQTAKLNGPCRQTKVG